MITDDDYVKMVTSRGECRFYRGTDLDAFDAAAWATYRENGVGIYNVRAANSAGTPAVNPSALLGDFFGPCVTPTGNGVIPITQVRRLAKGEAVFLAFDGHFVKMRSAGGESRYYPARASTDADAFRARDWQKYTLGGADSYNVRNARIGPPA